MLRLIDSVLRIAALVLFGVCLLTLLPSALWRSVGRIGYGMSWALETPGEARRRALGPEVAAAYDRLRREIPRDGEYLLIDGGAPFQGNPLWTRYELAPRKARLLGRWAELPPSAVLRRSWPPSVRFAVVALPEGQPPVGMEKEQLFSALERSHELR